MLFALRSEIERVDESVGGIDRLGDGREIGEESAVVEIGKILAAKAIGGECGQCAREHSDATNRSVVERLTGSGGVLLRDDKLLDENEALAEHEHSVVEAGEVRGRLRALGGAAGGGEVSDVVDGNAFGLV